MTHRLKYYKNNINTLTSMMNLTELLNCNKFIFSSSYSVYGNPDSLPVTESSELKPATSTYALTKRLGEEPIFL
jgi:UDP-glucose 4-epimerase